MEVPLRGSAGEPVDLRRTLASHGLASLPPMRLDEDGVMLEATVRLDGWGARTLRITPGRRGHAHVEVLGRAPGSKQRVAIVRVLRRMLCLDDDLSAFYLLAGDDPDLAWAAAGAGRILRASTVFEDVVKTVCTTNTGWSSTTRMVSAFVEHLGDEAPGGARAFPTPDAMASVGEDFYRDVARAGYRGRYFVALAESVASGTVDLEELLPAGGLADDEVASRLSALPGLGPYAVAHVMMLLGRHSRLVLDSWTRPTYARLVGRKAVSDRTIERRFRRYGPHAGLAFWLLLTRDWVGES